MVQALYLVLFLIGDVNTKTLRLSIIDDLLQCFNRHFDEALKVTLPTGWGKEYFLNR
jgi:hypothetical protein